MPSVKNLINKFSATSSTPRPPLRKKYVIPPVSPALTIKTQNIKTQNIKKTQKNINSSNNISSPTSVSNSSQQLPTANTTNDPTNNPTNNSKNNPTNKTQKVKIQSVNSQKGKIGEECDPEYTNEDPSLPKGMSKLWRSIRDPTKVIYSPNPPYKIKRLRAAFNGTKMVTVCKRKGRKSTSRNRKTRKN